MSDLGVPNKTLKMNTKNASFEGIIRSQTPVLVDFFATWCGPCKTMSPILQDFARQMGDRVRVIKIDVDKNQAVASKFNVQSIPTLILFQNSQIKWRHTGVAQKKQLEQVINGLNT
jgi:thioredoxin 1